LIYQFNQFTLDTESLELKQSGELVEVEPQVFSLLTCLIENSDRVVSKDEIIEQVWDGRIVSDGSLNSRINAARRAVGDDGSTQAVIKTFPRRGFRFVAEVGGDNASVRTLAARGSDKPSIAVLPFNNLSGEESQEYFSDGISEDIISALSRVREFRVVDRNTSFIYKKQAADIPTIAKELGVRYVLEGSVRKAGNRVRITTQLIDGESGDHLWAEKFDRELEDIFEVQDEITLTVVGAIEPTLVKVERGRIGGRNPENLDAWGHYHEGMAYIWDRGEHGQRDEVLLARENFLKSIELDPNFSRAYTGLAFSLFFDLVMGNSRDRSRTLEDAFAAAHKAVKLDPEDPHARGVLGTIYAVSRDPEAAMRECKIAIELNPSFARGYFWLGIAAISASKVEEGIGNIETGLRIGKHSPEKGPAMHWMALGHLILGEFEKAVDWARQSLSNPMTQFWGNATLTSAYGHLGNKNEAARAMETLLNRKPDFTIAFAKASHPVRNEDYLATFLDGLRKAGVPED